MMYQEGDWVIYRMIAQDVYGFIQKEGHLTHWFNTVERFTENKRPIMVGEDDLIPWESSVEAEDYTNFAELALDTKDQSWFVECMTKKMERELNAE